MRNNHEIMKSLNHEIENYSWGIIQDMIEGEVNAAFKLRQPTTIMPTKKEIKQIIKKTVREQRKNNETETISEKS